MSQVMDTSMARQFDKLPPHSIQAEMCLLASMMLDKEIVGQVVQIVDREVFYQADHQIIFDVLLKLYEVSIVVDQAQQVCGLGASSYSSCRRTKSIVVFSLRPFGARSRIIKVPINSSGPRP